MNLHKSMGVGKRLGFSDAVNDFWRPVMGECSRWVVGFSIDGRWSSIAPRPDLGLGDAKELSGNMIGDFCVSHRVYHLWV